MSAKNYECTYFQSYRPLPRKLLGTCFKLLFVCIVFVFSFACSQQQDFGQETSNLKKQSYKIIKPGFEGIHSTQNITEANFTKPKKKAYEKEKSSRIEELKKKYVRLEKSKKRYMQYKKSLMQTKLRYKAYQKMKQKNMLSKSRESYLNFKQTKRSLRGKYPPGYKKGNYEIKKFTVRVTEDGKIEKIEK